MGEPDRDNVVAQGIGILTPALTMMTGECAP